MRRRYSILDFGFWILDWALVSEGIHHRGTEDTEARSVDHERATVFDPKSKIQNPKSLSFLCVLCASAVILLSGCKTERVTTSNGGLPRSYSQPVAPPPTPRDAKANRMAFFVGQKPDDTNGNGYPDLISVTVMLFATPHPTAIVEPGQFVFTLYPQGTINEPGVKALGTWRLDDVRSQAALAVTLGGPCYQFQLSMLDPSSGFTSDKLPLDQADLVCQFIPADAALPPVQCEGVRTIQIGKRLASGATNR
jgi:hypothetical protein